MMKEIFISALGCDFQVAIVEQEKLIHFFSESYSEKSFVGNIYLGTIVRVLPGMQAAFVDLGLSRTGFLHLRDIVSNVEHHSIEALLHQGKQLLVQVLKDPIGSKGARLTTEITLPSTHLVYRPYEKNNGISQKIEKEEERQRLQKIMEQFPLKGLIARTAAEGQSAEILKKDNDYLQKRWTCIQEASLVSKNENKLIYEELILPYKLLRDFGKYTLSKIFVDREEWFEKIKIFIQDFLPHLTADVILESPAECLFNRYAILTQFKASLKPEVMLKSGGSIVIEQTESMTTIDVNTSRFVGKKNQDETILKTNIEAARIIGHQIQLRGLGGLIVIDFIDMQKEEDRLQVYTVLKEVFKHDMMPTHVLPMSELGLIEMTRKRISESFDQKYFTTCTRCHGQGRFLEPAVVAFEVFCGLMQMLKQKTYKKFMIVASPKVIAFLEKKEPNFIDNLLSLDIHCRLNEDDRIPLDQFELIPLKD